MDCWNQIQSHIRTNGGLTPQQFTHWVEPVGYSHVAPDRTLHVEAPNEVVKGWLESECRPLIDAAIRRLGLDVSAYEVALQPPPDERKQPRLDFGDGPRQFNSKYTFGRFVVGDCNQFAHAASQAVANNPAEAYNPLYIYAGVGMGKTHLLHAIGHAAKTANADFTIVYTSAEEFMNDMISSIRMNNMKNFHYRYRMADMLLVDDIQILGSKERTQEEFFHTFNVLHNRGKQIVLSSDADPNRIPGLVGRLRSRFSWGLLADIQAPDLETRIAILDSKSQEQGMPLPPDVTAYIASRLTSNIRELEGLLNRLIARSRFTNCRITKGMVESILGNPLPPADGMPTIEAIKDRVAAHYGISPADLVKRGNSRQISHPRQVAMYLAKRLTKSPLKTIGKAFGKHHTTVLHSVKKIQNEVQANDTTRSTIEVLMSGLSG